MSGNNMIKVNTDEQARYEEYAELLVRRDQLFKEAESYMTSYTAEFGDLITANFELKIECIKKKKTISYCRRRMNRGLAIDVERMHAEIEQEMQLYHAQLREMITDTENAKKAEIIGSYRFNRAKRIYRKLAKLIHPDVNKKTMENEKLKDLWMRIVVAYQRSDVDELDDLEVLVLRALDELGEKGFELNTKDIEERIERVERQINDILNTEPYTYGELLRDEEKKAAYREQLVAEGEDFKQYLESLTRTLDDMLREGGAKIIWKMD
ncbi:MAG: hypothetical protein IK081_15385 [Lachnospiraceae bacterium]|nr:hypothetical protein [Lachnospiraceae bacterium]